MAGYTGGEKVPGGYYWRPAEERGREPARGEELTALEEEIGARRERE